MPGRPTSTCSDRDVAHWDDNDQYGPQRLRDLNGASTLSRRTRVLTDDHQLLSTRVIACDFLDASECAETARRVSRLRDRWTRRSDFGFFTLGAASYIDGCESRDTYLAAAGQTNSLLCNVFGDLYSGLRGFAEYVLDEPVGYDERLAMPGFHIFEFDGTDYVDDYEAQRAHFDLQFLCAIPGGTPDATLSFTLPLEQPSGGASLAVWPLRYEEAVRRNLTGPGFAEQNPCDRVIYKTGRMILHDGFLLHAIGAPSVAAPMGKRITLQGHGVRYQGRWTIYW
jgi:hypothetical protein